ncbi:hypothetical protein NPIL_694921 [Nephila pilipes]|uniref:Uncharacterized protein n=1 Tax=Nephila pilipes TaxID=299642 RepID=A0A8X6PMN3_NEPPI|nr:hypothetical protein NPIL_694921 [Nephila pilipes]
MIRESPLANFLLDVLAMGHFSSPVWDLGGQSTAHALFITYLNRAQDIFQPGNITTPLFHERAVTQQLLTRDGCQSNTGKSSG